MKHAELVLILKAMADTKRLSIIQRLAQQPEICACNLLEDFNITQPTLSFHMKKLQACGLVKAYKDGVWMRYSLNQDQFKAAHAMFDFKTEADSQKCTCHKD